MEALKEEFQTFKPFKSFKPSEERISVLPGAGDGRGERLHDASLAQNVILRRSRRICFCDLLPRRAMMLRSP